MVEIANSNMIEALRLVSVQRGFDPREFSLVAFGGAGPLHANAIARELAIPEVIIPLSPGVSSALGLLLADIQHDFVRTYIKPLKQVDLDVVNRAFDEFEAAGRDLLEREGVPVDDQRFVRELDMRLCGQSFELKVAAPFRPLGREHLTTLEADFHRLHERAYGHSFPGEPVEVVNLRLTARGVMPKPRIKRHRQEAGPGAPGEEPLKGRRPVCFDAAEGYLSTPIYDRYKLPPFARIIGPAVLEEFDSTVVVHPGFEANVDEFGSIRLVASAVDRESA
jgi:N-methylhydantoinase A